MTAQGMNMGGNFTPGRGLNPYFGYSTPARATDYPVGVNIATQGRAAWGRVSFDVIKALIDAYDVARMCINHKIDELRSMPLMFQPADGIEDDVDDAITAARLVLAYPDRELPYDSWLSKWLENALKYDAAPLYRRRDYNGDIIGLEVVDGRTIAPYIDENGRRPQPPAPAYWQVIHGMVGTWFTTDDLIYTPFRPQEDSPYGLAPIESVVITANTDIRFQWHFLQLFTDGSVPAGFMELPPDISEPEQVREWQDHWDAMVMGDQAKLHQLLAVPNGSKFTGTKPAAFDEKFPQYLMRRTAAAFGVVPQDLGFVQDVNRANGETQIDVQFRVNTLPWVRFVEGTLSRYLQHDLGLPVKVSLDTGRDKEDRLQEAQAHQLYVEMGAESPDEVRVDVLGKRVDKTRPWPRFFATQRIGPMPQLAVEGVAGKTDPDTYGPAKDQPVLDQPFVPPIGALPAPGSSDDKASQAALDEYQVSARRQLEEEHGGRSRESEADREARGAKRRQPDAGQAPRGQQGQQGGAQQQEAEPVAKSADLTGAEAEELAAFREFVRCSKRRGYYRDFVFKAVSPVVAAELNRGARGEVASVLKAKGQDAPKGNTVDANEVYQQLAENFPADATRWVLDQHWTREDVPLDQIDWSNMASWRASRQPKQIAKLARKMGKGKAGKPAILIDRPGKPTMMIADGHHHTLARRARHEPVPAYVAHVTKVTGPWDEMHARQHGDANYDAPVTKSDGDPKAPARSADTWPGWQWDLAAAAYWGPRVAAAVLGAVDTAAIAQAWLASPRDQGDGRDEKARRDALIAFAFAWLAQYQRRINAALRPVLAEVATDGYAIGTAAALAVTSGQPMILGDWQPGDTGAAERLILREGDPAGLRALFEAAQHTIGLMADTRTDAMARALADAALRGDSPGTLGAALRALLADPERARMLALDQITRASSAGAQAVYARRSVATHRWLTEEDGRVCAICDGNAAAGSTPLGMPFPSGDLGAPAHPRCRCATIPG